MANKVYFGFAIADSMLENCERIHRKVHTPESAKVRIAEAAHYGALVVCANPSHEATIKAMQERFGIEVEIPATPPKVALEPNDCLVVMGVRGLPRLTDRHEYTAEEVAGTTFSFSEYFVIS